MRRVLPLFCVASLAACATPRVWDKPNVTPDLVNTELDECRRLVLDDMWRLGWERSWPPRFYDPLFMPPYYRSSQPFWLDFPSSLERELTMIDFCMHSKGYRLRALPY